MRRAAMTRKLPKKYFHLVFSLLMGAAMVSIVTFAVTAANVGFGSEFLTRWVRAFSVAYCVAVPLIYYLAPAMGRLTARLVEMPGPSAN
jgi:hypothetical protein